MTGLLIVGAGGHGRVVADTAQLTGKWDKIAFLDDEIRGSVLNWPVLGPIEKAMDLIEEYGEITVAIGNNRRRVELLRGYAKMGFSLPAIIHPLSFISDTVEFGAGSVAFAQTAVNAGAKIGFGCIINTGTTVDHDCLLEEGVHLSPGVHLAGGVRIGKYTWIGIGASVIQQISVGENVLVGAGSVLINSVNEVDCTVVGVPGRVIKRNDK